MVYKVNRYVITLLLLFPRIALCSSEVYKYTDHEGNTVYSDKPPVEATDSQRVVLQPVARASEVVFARNRAKRLLAAEQALVRRLNERAVRRDELRNALAALKDTERTLEISKEALPDELQRLRGGGVRLRDEYYARIGRLEARVADARSDVRHARLNLKH